VADVPEQDRVVGLISKAFPNATVIDRRRKDSHGYRAVHLVAEINGRFIEIQVRTKLQHLWAVWSEALADEHGQALKYGGGPPDIQSVLTVQSAIFQAMELFEELIRTRLNALTAGMEPTTLKDAVIKPLPAEVLETMKLSGDLEGLIRSKEAEVERITREILKLKREKKR
jgi:hypothetical protein